MPLFGLKTFYPLSSTPQPSVGTPMRCSSIMNYNYVFKAVLVNLFPDVNDTSTTKLNTWSPVRTGQIVVWSNSSFIHIDIVWDLWGEFMASAQVKMSNTSTYSVNMDNIFHVGNMCIFAKSLASNNFIYFCSSSYILTSFDN